MERHAVVLLSGGLDSATMLAIAKHDGFILHALSFDYGQRHKLELTAARAVANSLGVREHVIAAINLRVFGGSSLTTDEPIETDRTPDEMVKSIPTTYVPARNTIFLAFALAYAETRGAKDIFIGVNALDYAGYPDCRPEYIAAYEHMANLATKVGTDAYGNAQVKIHTPLIHWTKADIIRAGLALKVDYSLTSTCYDPELSGACGRCDACKLRQQGFAENGTTDPITYRP